MIPNTESSCGFRNEQTASHGSSPLAVQALQQLDRSSAVKTS
jgi:hypothetical protein